MTTYNVNVYLNCSETIQVEAESEKEAELKALKIAQNIEFAWCQEDIDVEVDLYQPIAS